MPATAPLFSWRVPIPWAPETPPTRKIPSQVEAGPDVGVPIGGIGAGTFTRGVNGGFNRTTIKSGQVFMLDLPECGFALWQEGQGARALRPTAPEGWHADPAGRQAALFPKAWHRYRSGDVDLVIEQITPVAPALTEDRDLPLGVFRVHLSNEGAAASELAVMFSFANLCGWFGEVNGPGHPAGVPGCHNHLAEAEDHLAVIMERDRVGPLGEGDGQMTLAVGKQEGLTLSAIPGFDPKREGQGLWETFARDGSLGDMPEAWTTGGGITASPSAAPCAAISARVTLAPGEQRVVDFVLVWDFPVIRFGQGRKHHRHYTTRWGADGKNAQAIAAHALAEVDQWSTIIDVFHRTEADALALSPEATALAINELYALTDGCVVWTAPEGGCEHFGIIESPDYQLYNTLDLWVYAVAAVADLFPDLAALVTSAYAAEVARNDPEPRMQPGSTTRFQRQRAGLLPRDLGTPSADPFHRAGDYVYRDASQWKDLNSMFVLNAWRDLRAGVTARSLWPSVKQAMETLAQFDLDGDGMIENDATPDQTFDNIPMTGISAFCGGLWLAALRAAAEMAALAGDRASYDHWKSTSRRAAQAYEDALWTGSYFRLDSAGEISDALFAEQLFGPAMARMLGLGDVVDPEKAQRALREIFRVNFRDAGSGRGVVAVTSSSPSPVTFTPHGLAAVQWDEIMVGFNFSFAAQLRAYGLEAECQTLMEALAEELGPERGLHFRTPAALMPGRPEIRSQMNMRCLGVWALKDAARYRNG